MTERDAAGARRELEESLRLLQADHLDLDQLHALTKPEEVERAFAPGGAWNKASYELFGKIDKASLAVRSTSVCRSM